MSPPLRTLPIRLAPRPGEALDSWLERVAARLDTPLRDLTAALGLRRDRARVSAPRWTVALHPDEIDALITTAGGNREQYHRMTLASYDGTAVVVNHAERTTARTAVWSRTVGSRFCPDCLRDHDRDHDAVWLLSWRLGWTYACQRHRRLLAEACPTCTAPTRMVSHPLTIVPHPGHCPASTGGSRSPRCDAELAAADSFHLPDDHPALATASALDDAIGHQRVPRAYTEAGLGVRDLLGDITALAQLLLTHAPDALLRERLPPDLVEAHLYDRAQRKEPPTRPGISAPPAATTAAAVVFAMRVLSEPDRRDAAAHLRDLVRRARDDGRSRFTAGNVGKLGSAGCSSILTSALTATLDAEMRSHDQLRHRSHRHETDYLDPRPDLAAPRLRWLPQQLWPAASSALISPDTVGVTRHLRAGLAAAIGLVGTRMTLNDVRDGLGSGRGDQGLGYTLRRLSRHPSWPTVARALDRLASYLDIHGAPIDYARRRALDYQDLLSHEEWLDIRVRIGFGRSPKRLRNARLFLYVLLTGNDPLSAPSGYAPTTPQQLASYGNFPADLTPPLREHLLEIAAAFLHARGIDEPVTWQPPTPTLLTGLDLPGPLDDANVDLEHLHRLVRDAASSTDIAHELDASIDQVRDMLTRHPEPTTGAVACRRLKNTGRPGGRTPAQVRRRYFDDGHSISAIATTYGLPRSLIAEVIGPDRVSEPCGSR